MPCMLGTCASNPRTCCYHHQRVVTASLYLRMPVESLGSVPADSVAADAVAICFVCACCRRCPGQAGLRYHIKLQVAQFV